VVSTGVDTITTGGFSTTASGLTMTSTVSGGSTAGAVIAGEEAVAVAGAAAAGGALTTVAMIAIPITGAAAGLLIFKYVHDMNSAPYAYVGCWADDNHRDLDKRTHNVWGRHMAANCSYHCKEYLFFGIQYGKECWCGNAFGTEPKYTQRPDSECDTRFGSRKGDSWRNAIFTHHYKPVGCFKDDNSRDFPNSTLEKGFFGGASGSNPYNCSFHCKDYKFFALQNGGECRCGNSYGTKSKYSQVNPQECSKNRKSLWLGGPWRNYVFDRRAHTRTPYTGVHEVPMKNPKIGCSSAATKEFQIGPIHYACTGKWDIGGVEAGAKALCATDYHLCTYEDMQFVDKAKCNALDGFYAAKVSSAGWHVCQPTFSGKNDVWGCGNTCSVTKDCGTIKCVLGGGRAVAGWQYSDGENEFGNARATDASKGGVMCCRDG